MGDVSGVIELATGCEGMVLLDPNELEEVEFDLADDTEGIKGNVAGVPVARAAYVGASRSSKI